MILLVAIEQPSYHEQHPTLLLLLHLDTFPPPIVLTPLLPLSSHPSSHCPHTPPPLVLTPLIPHLLSQPLPHPLPPKAPIFPLVLETSSPLQPLAN